MASPRPQVYLPPAQVFNTTPDERQAAQLPVNYRNQDANELTVNPQLMFELALGVTKADKLFAKYGYSNQQALEMIDHPTFVSKVEEYRTEILKSGVSFKLKAKIQAEDNLSISHMLVHDAMTPAAVRADLIKWTAKVAGLEPGEKGGGVGGAAGFQLNIIMPNSTESVRLEAVPAIESTAERV